MNSKWTAIIQFCGQMGVSGDMVATSVFLQLLCLKGINAYCVSANA